jgi:hypothetical protein
MSRGYVLKNPRRGSPEKEQVRTARKFMVTSLSFDYWSLQQARATNQTPGWPDCLFTHPEKRLAVWYEAKAPNGRQSDAQKLFQRHVTSCGHEYVVGVASELYLWAESKKLVRILPSGAMEILRKSA